MENKRDSIAQFDEGERQNPKHQEGVGEAQKTESKPKEELKYKDAVLAYSNATLGISMVVAVLIGVGIGYGLESLFGSRWLFWLGVVWGVCAAILNVFKAYKRQKREFDELAKDPKYSYKPKAFDEEEDD